MDTLKVKVGTLILTKKHVVSKSYECAAWFKHVEVKPGEYPVYAYLNWEYGHSAHAGHWRVHSLAMVVEGVTVAGNFTPLFAGNPIGKSRDVRGEVDTAVINLPTYGMLADHPDGLTQVAIHDVSDRSVQTVTVKLDDVFHREVYSPAPWGDEVGPKEPMWSLRWRKDVKVQRKEVQEGPRYSGSTWDAEVV